MFGSNSHTNQHKMVHPLDLSRLLDCSRLHGNIGARVHYMDGQRTYIHKSGTLLSKHLLSCRTLLRSVFPNQKKDARR